MTVMAFDVRPSSSLLSSRSSAVSTTPSLAPSTGTPDRPDHRFTLDFQP